jgi:hypothetical protein
MGKPFQFSIGRTLAAVALCCLGIGLPFWCISIKLFGTAGTFPALVGLLASGALPSAGLGLLIRRPVILARRLSVRQALLATWKSRRQATQRRPG